MRTSVHNAQPNQLLKVVTSTGITAATLAAAAPGAIANKRPVDTTEATAALIEQVAPFQGEVLEPTHADGAATAHVDPDESISLHSSDSASATTHRFHEGVVPELLEDGSVALIVPGDGTDQQIGAISTPWAVDVKGAPVTIRPGSAIK